MKVGYRRILFAAVIAAAGCGSLQSVTSGQVGCPEGDIKILDENRGWSTTTWTAECNGHRFFCTTQAGGNNSMQTTCKEAVTPPTGYPPAPQAGCQYDTQCKGNRVCRAGSCADP